MSPEILKAFEAINKAFIDPIKVSSIDEGRFIINKSESERRISFGIFTKTKFLHLYGVEQINQFNFSLHPCGINSQFLGFHSNFDFGFNWFFKHYIGTRKIL